MAPSQQFTRLPLEQLRDIAYANAYRDLQHQADAKLLLYPLPACPTCNQPPSQILSALSAESPDDKVMVTFLDCRHRFSAAGIDVERADRWAREAARSKYNGPAEAPAQPPGYGDWHETLVGLLALDHGIPEERARRFLARYADEVRPSTPVPCHARECPCPPGCGCCTATPAAAMPVSDDHPCAHCTHPKRAHLEDPVWCRNCPPDTSYNGDPGWHKYEQAKEQR